MSFGPDLAVASSQHPNGVEAIAEIVTTLTERQAIAPSLTLVAVSGRFQLDGAGLGHAIHSLLQSDQTLVCGTSQLVGGSQILDSSGSVAVLSVADMDVTINLDHKDSDRQNLDSKAVGYLGGDPADTIDFRSSGNADAAVLVRAGGAGGPLWHFDGDRRIRCSRADITFHSIRSLLTTSVGSCPVGLPAPVTASDGYRILTIDGSTPRSLIIDRLELDGADADGPSFDLPRMAVEVTAEPGSRRLVAVTGSDSADGSITVATPISPGSIAQLVRHDPKLAADDVVSRQRRGPAPAPRAVLLTSTLPPGTANSLVTTAADILSPDLLGFVGQPPRGPDLPWPSASLLTLR